MTAGGMWTRSVGIVATALLLGGAIVDASAKIVEGNPSNARKLASSLKPGDTLKLAAGTYTSGMRLNNLRGTPDAWITIEGPDSGDPAVFMARRGANTLGMRNCCYVAIRNLHFDGKHIRGVDAIKASTVGQPATHHIIIEGCTIKNHDGHQNTVGISTKTDTWGWIIRNNRVISCGTGLYLGNSDGHRPFVNGLIENNLIVNPIGYCMQIKYQKKRPDIEGMPQGPCSTIIRNNVFIKNDRHSDAGNRPNLLVGNFPDSGDGSQDLYEIYGNLFVHNPRESLLQVAGGVTIHDNVFVDVKGNAIRVQSNRGHPVKRVSIYNNTFYKAGTGVSIGDRAHVDQLIGNLIFAGRTTRRNPKVSRDNIVGSVADAATYLTKPSVKPGEMNFYPLEDKCQGEPLDLSAFSKDKDYNLDFNGQSKGDFKYRGAYAGSGENPGWKLQAENKPNGPGSGDK